MDFFGKNIWVNAPEFPGGLTWLNSSPLTISKLKGKVVLMDFWTYSCINCQRTLLYLKKWWEKYSKNGLVLIGVHSPEFEFEKDPKNVRQALEKYEVTWPVVLDNDMQIWDSYSNHWWPAKYLVDKDGKIIYTHFGEGNYIETEIKIQEALKDTGFQVDNKLVSGEDSTNFSQNQTPELYFGSLRGYVENIPQDISIQEDRIYTIGKWRQEAQYLQHSNESKDLDDLVILNYRAKKVFLVMESENLPAGRQVDPIKVYITLDGVGLTGENAGDNIDFDKEGRSFVEVKFSTLYNLVSTPTFGDHTLRISTTSNKLRLFAFTFGG